MELFHWFFFFFPSHQLAFPLTLLPHTYTHRFAVTHSLLPWVLLERSGTLAQWKPWWDVVSHQSQCHGFWSGKHLQDVHIENHLTKSNRFHKLCEIKSNCWESWNPFFPFPVILHDYWFASVRHRGEGQWPVNCKQTSLLWSQSQWDFTIGFSLQGVGLLQKLQCFDPNEQIYLFFPYSLSLSFFFQPAHTLLSEGKKSLKCSSVPLPSPLKLCLDKHLGKHIWQHVRN